MANGDLAGADFEIRAERSQTLLAQGGVSRTYFAFAGLHFHSRKGAMKSALLPFRLDTGAFVSVIPQRWVANLGTQILGILSDTMSFSTSAGQGSGRLARGVRVSFPDLPNTICSFDFLATPGLDQRNYGLICLTDVINNFSLETEGTLELEADGTPRALPGLRLYPRSIWQRVRYRCQSCRVTVWGRPGLALSCCDCNLPLDAV